MSHTDDDFTPTMRQTMTGDDSVQTAAFRVEGLIGRQDPAKAASWALENLYNTVAEWPADSLMALVIRREEQAIHIEGWVNEAAPTDWFADMSYALKPIAQLVITDTLPALSTPLVEVVPVRESVAASFDPAPAQHPAPGRDAVPLHRADDMQDFLEVLRTVPGGAIGMFISPASQLEQEMCDATWKPMFAGSSKMEWQVYRGTPIRTRVILYSDAATIPARLRAELKIVSSFIDFTPVTGPDVVALRLPTVDQVKGWAIPKETFRALVHLPAAAVGFPIPGVKVLPAPPLVLPYDAFSDPEVGIRIGSCVTSVGERRPVLLEAIDVLRHAQIMGATGGGKSTLLRSLALSWTEQGYGGLVLDAHGTLCQDLIADVEDSNRVLYVDYSDTEHPAPYNLFSCTFGAGPGSDEEFEASVQAFVDIIVSRDSTQFTGPRWRRLFSLVARGCRILFRDRCSLVSVFSILGSQPLTRQLIAALKDTNRPLADQLHQELGSVAGESASELWSWLVAKGEEVLGSSALTQVLGSGAHLVNLIEAMDDDKLVLVNLGLPELGERSAQLLGCMWIAEVRLAMMRRKRRDRPWLLAVDEAHLFQYGALPSILDEGRKFGVGLVVSHQRPDQLEPQLHDALASNAGTYIQLRTGSVRTAAAAAQVLDGWPASDLLRMKDLAGAAMLMCNGVQSTPFSLELDFYEVEASRLKDAELRAVKAARVVANTRARTAAIKQPVMTRDTVEEELGQSHITERVRLYDELKRRGNARNDDYAQLLSLQRVQSPSTPIGSQGKKQSNAPDRDV